MKVLLIILGVIAAIIILLVVLLHFSIKAYIEADKKHVSVVVKYLGFKLFSTEIPDENKDEDDKEDKPPEEMPKSEPEIVLTEAEIVDSTDDAEKAEIDKKIAEAAENATENEKEEESGSSEDESSQEKSEDKSEDEEEENEPKPSLLDQYNEFKKYIPAGKKAFRKLLKLIRFYDLRFELTVGNDDPYKAGLNFGRINTAVYSLLGLLCCIFSVKIDHTEIKCDFEEKRTDFYFKTAVYVRPSAVIALAAYIGVYYLKIRKSMKKLENMAKEKVS